MPRLPILLACITSTAFSQKSEWIGKPRDQWPQIAMVNEVWYQNGERYVHPSFEYAGTGFLIDTGKDTLAATVKHVLIVAKTKAMHTVYIKDELQRWIMHPKGNLKDSVVVEQLINSDSTEALNGPGSTITQRDWLVFTAKYVSHEIQPLKPRYTTVKVGERIWYFGCPYNDKNCMIGESTILDVAGNRIIFSIPKGSNLGGASGSPIVDENGLLIGRLGGSSVTKTGEGALYGISTNYLHKVLTNEKRLNVPLIPISDVRKLEIIKNGISAGLKKFSRLKKKDANLFVYDFSAEKLNKLADDFMTDKKTDWA